jgi:hypothetical protein
LADEVFGKRILSINRGRPRARRMLTDMPTRQRLFDLFDLAATRR